MFEVGVFVVRSEARRVRGGVFHVGDIAYNLHRDEGGFGDRYLKTVEKFTNCVPYMTVPGDHERFLDYYHYRYRLNIFYFFFFFFFFNTLPDILRDVSSACTIATVVRYLT